ncbi:hypothetical protein [Tropicibacter sp. S64]|uniref:hypothetical protein n=1 Tax=Tropicibacter sp. S64 TaxID=3415122 RepID=UPI003C7B3D18
MSFAFALNTALSASPGSYFGLQSGRAAKEVTAVTLSRTSPASQAAPRGAQITVTDKPLRTYDNPLLGTLAENPMSGAEMGLTMVAHLRSGGAEVLARSEADLTLVMAEALGVPATDEDGEAPTLAALRDLAGEQGQADLVRAADTFTRHAEKFHKTLDKLERTFTNLKGPDTGDATVAHVQRAVGMLVDAQIEPQKVRMELDALRGAALLQMTGASRDQVDRALSLRRATGRLALQTRRKSMVDGLMQDYKAGRIAATVTTKTVWADQQVSVDASKARGTTVAFSQTYDHYASASLNMTATSALALTLRTV